MSESVEYATLAGGCFWCVEAAFEAVEGVASAISGYTGGHVADPTYKAVCSGRTGHAEAVQIEYDPERVGYEDLLAIFFTIHDPTTRDRQGPDVGSQYRSAIFYHDDTQRELAREFMDALAEEGAYEADIVTELEPLEDFYEAEEYHQDYYEKNPADGYCSFYAEPKVTKVRKQFPSLTTP